jgi:GNAT superfamily N-acetyltransferase
MSQLPVEIRPFSGQDYNALADLSNAVYPEYRVTAEELREDDEFFDREGKYLRRRYVAVDLRTGELVGYASVSHMPFAFHPQKFQMGLMVHPERRKQGIGSKLYERLANDLQELNAVSVKAWVLEDRTEAITFLQRRGFNEVFRSWELRLDVRDCDLQAFLSTVERVASQGISITTLKAELQADPECLPKLYELQRLISQDIPAPDQITFVSYEEFVEHMKHSEFLSDAYFIAKDGDRYIGISNLWRSRGEPEKLYQGVTGVLREYRKRGIATALKVKTIEYARNHSYRFIVTQNASVNAEMLALNEKLGFKRSVGIITMERKIATCSKG